MPLAIDSQMPSNVAFSNGNVGAGPATFNFTNTAGTFMLIGAVAGNSVAGFTPVTGITYDGAALSPVSGASVQYDGGNKGYVGLFSLLTPATGTKQVSVAVTGGDSGTGSATVIAAVMTFTGHDTTTPIVAASGKNNHQDASQATASVVSGTSTVGNLVIAMMGTGAGYVSTAQTLSASKNDNTHSAAGNGAMTYANGSGGAITMSDTITSDFWGMVCAEVAAASGGGGGTGSPAAGAMTVLGVQ